MKFQMTPEGMLFIADQSPEDVHELLKFFRLKITDHLPELTAGHMEYLSKASWFEVSTILGAEWLAPYLKKLGEFTDTPVPEMTPLPWNEYNWSICHTHLVEKAWFEDGCYVSEGYIIGREWNGQTAEVRAERNYAEYVRDFVGATKQEPEFIDKGYGRESKNPNYMKRHYPHPEFSSKNLFLTLLKATATPAQLEFLETWTLNPSYSGFNNKQWEGKSIEDYRLLS